MIFKRKVLAALPILMIIGLACSSEPACDPVVVVTGINYTQNPGALPYTEIHGVFAENYSGADLSISLRDDIIGRMREKADSLAEDSEILFQCIKATYTTAEWDERPTRIPCYAEKCIYSGEPVWAIAFNRVNSFEEEKLEHFDIFFVSSLDYEILHYDGCL